MRVTWICDVTVRWTWQNFGPHSQTFSSSANIEGTRTSISSLSPRLHLGGEQYQAKVKNAAPTARPDPRSQSEPPSAAVSSAQTAETSESSMNPQAQATSTPAVPSPSKSPTSPAKPTYNTAPSSSTDDDLGEIKKNGGDDEITRSRATRANIAQQLFRSTLPRPTFAATNSPVASRCSSSLLDLASTSCASFSAPPLPLHLQRRLCFPPLLLPAQEA